MLTKIKWYNNPSFVKWSIIYIKENNITDKQEKVRKMDVLIANKHIYGRPLSKLYVLYTIRDYNLSSY